jgi:hypothetical protein
VIQQIARPLKGKVEVSPQNQTSRQHVFQPVSEGLVFRKPEILNLPQNLPPGVDGEQAQVVNIDNGQPANLLAQNQ